ncbi:DUF6420 family protein [Streptomyces sp. NPDC054950]
MNKASAFVRAALAVELGDFTLVDRLLEETEARFGPVRSAEEVDEDDQAEAS